MYESCEMIKLENGSEMGEKEGKNKEKLLIGETNRREKKKKKW